MKRLILLIALALFTPWISAAAAASATDTSAHPAKKKKSAKKRVALGPLYAGRADVMQQADDIARRLQLDKNWVRKAIGQSRYTAGIAKAVLPPPPGVAKNWALYRDRFVEPQRIEAGVRFWRANQDALTRAQTQFGLPPSIVVGIVGVETFYGQNTGNFRVADALCTLAFDFPAEHPNADARRAYFRSELEAYLALTARTHTDPLALRGSYAGAMGWPQFMPSSWTQYAVDFDSDGHVDLFNSQSDVIGSVANYFQAHHWQSGMPTHFVAHPNAQAQDLQALLQSDIVPTYTASELLEKGIALDGSGPLFDGKLSLIALQNGDAPPDYIAGTDNFFVVTRYNRSAYYAMAVIALGDAVQRALQNSQNTATPPNAGASTDAGTPDGMPK